MNPFITLVIVVDAANNSYSPKYENRKIRINFNQIITYREFTIKRNEGTTTRSKLELNGAGECSITYYTAESPEAIDLAISQAITNSTRR